MHCHVRSLTLPQQQHTPQHTSARLPARSLTRPLVALCCTVRFGCGMTVVDGRLSTRKAPHPTTLCFIRHRWWCRRLPQHSLTVSRTNRVSRSLRQSLPPSGAGAQASVPLLLSPLCALSPLSLSSQIGLPVSTSSLSTSMALTLTKCHTHSNKRRNSSAQLSCGGSLPLSLTPLKHTL